MLVVVFWTVLACALYSYFIYPLILMMLPRRPDDGIATEGEDRQSFSLIITAYNEEARIRNKLLNALALDRADFELEIIVASDCSTDGTDDIVAEFAEQGIRLVRARERLGKENAQLAAIQQAQGQILVFSDVATEMPSDALKKLAHYFSNSEVGAVSSEDRFISSDGKVAGEGAYVKYEMWLRKLESQRAGLVGLSGSFFAARRSVCQQWDIHSPSDFNTALNCVRLGYKAITAPDVVGYYHDLKDPQKEYARKIRTVIRGMTSLARHSYVMNPRDYGPFAFQVLSHKLMRWLVPWFLLLLLVINIPLASGNTFYSGILMAQVLFYGLALLAHYSGSLQRKGPVRLVYFFVQVNAAIMAASCRFLSGTRMTVWTPSTR